MNRFDILRKYRKDWNKFAYDVLDIKTLDKQQQEAIYKIQNNKKVSIRSGNSRGKDFIGAVSSLCFLLLNIPSKVINTAPTGRQVYNIMMAEIGRIWENANYNLGGRKLNTAIKFEDDNHFLLGFKAGDTKKEAWQGFHSPNIMVVVTEASGINDKVYESIEGILTGNSKLLLIFNPMKSSGETYKSTISKKYKSIRLNSMDAPNVLNYEKVLSREWTEEQYKKNKIPGQVDWAWVNDKVGKAGWSYKISKDEYTPDKDFVWRGKYYRALDPFRIRVLGKFPLSSSDTLIERDWIELSHKRWKNYECGKARKQKIVGVDVAGQGRDKTVFTERVENYVKNIDVLNINIDDTIHMQIAGIVKQRIEESGGIYFIDTVGEGAGVFSRLAEQKVENVYGAKGSYSAKGLTDYHELKEFNKMRDFIYWAVRDALDPKNEFNLMLPPNDELDEELLSMTYSVKSNGKIKIKSKDDIKQEIGRSPDIADSLAMTFTPI
ncbi:MAG: hypothetical protein KGY74_09045 [Candidatus Cloacimonetes bacterium]|nr:hypothetical protein [Candidatus Cloacimonadota bacterium]